MVRVAFQGEHGAYSELAAERLWPGAKTVPCREMVDVVRAVAREVVNVGVLPIENSIAGTVTSTLDALLEADGVHLTGEAIVPIHHCLLALPGATIDRIRWVQSHPVALAQCRSLFARYPTLEARIVYDTAGAARDVAASRNAGRAAIASAVAAQRYGLAILAENIEDRPDNRTRFVAVSRAPACPADGVPCRTTLAVTTDDRAGALMRVLAPFAHAGLGVTSIDARPAGAPWTYVFVLDIAHEAGDERMADALCGVRDATRSCRLLGTYPAATEDR